MATVPDSVTGCVAYSILEASVDYGTVDPNVKMVKAVPVDVSLVAAGRVLHLSHTVGMSEGALKTQDGTSLAYATVTRVICRP